MIKLYGIPRSRTIRPLWMLEELGLPYENVKVSFVNETRTPAFLNLNPNGRIPVLQDGNLTLWESMAINLYLARRYDKGLWPKGVEDEGPLGRVVVVRAHRPHCSGVRSEAISYVRSRRERWRDVLVISPREGGPR